MKITCIIHEYPLLSVDKQLSLENENSIKYNSLIFEGGEAAKLHAKYTICADICQQMLTVASACTVYALHNVYCAMSQVCLAMSHVILFQLKKMQTLEKKLLTS